MLSIDCKVFSKRKIDRWHCIWAIQKLDKKLDIEKELKLIKLIKWILKLVPVVQFVRTIVVKYPEWIDKQPKIPDVGARVIRI